MLIPIGHEQMTARRWPVITFALIAINLVVFALTNSVLQKEVPELAKVKEHILRLAAMHEELEVPDAARDMVEKYKAAHPDEWKMQSRESRPVADEWDMRIRGMGRMDVLTRSELQSEMNTLVDQYVQLQGDSLLEKYAFVPARPTGASYITANFLHGGWLHVIFNMWFLWLAGFLLEDVWGRIAFPIFYLAGGVAALMVHALANPGSITPCLGASGAVAAVMGAFMVRFPWVKIKMWGLVFLRVFRFEAAAIWLLPFWLAKEVLFGFVWGGFDGVAHWAHVGGFAFGAVGAFAFRFCGIERKMDQAIVEKINKSVPETYDAEQLMQEGNLSGAQIALEDVLERNPHSIEALQMMRDLHWRRSETSQYQDMTLTLCQEYLRKRDLAAAWQCYEEFLSSGGQMMAAAVWLDVCRVADESQRYERAVQECEKLIATYPNTREALMAQIRAGRICQKQLVQPGKALAFYEAASVSPVPHLDMEQTISLGIRECRAAGVGVGAV